MLQSAQNPKDLFIKMIESDPQIKEQVDLLNSVYNGNAWDLFYAECAKKGMSRDQADQFLSSFKQSMMQAGKG